MCVINSYTIQFYFYMSFPIYYCGWLTLKDPYWADMPPLCVMCDILYLEDPCIADIPIDMPSLCDIHVDHYFKNHERTNSLVNRSSICMIFM